MLVRTIFFFSIIFFVTPSFASCNFKTSEYISELDNPKNIKFIEIEIPKSQRYVKNFLQTLSSSFKNQIILPKYKKRFFAKINVEYDFGRCEFEGKIRQSGDWPDHIKVKDGNPLRSLDVRLNNGNILNAVKFKLLIPETRNDLNEILGSLILKELGFITPETFQVFAKVNGITNLMIFQEKSAKELLERNNRKEGPIFEGDEELLWKYEDYRINELENVSLAKLLNENWFNKGKNNQIITLKAFQRLQLAYLEYIGHHIKSKTFIYPNLLKNEVFLNYHLILEIINGHHALRPHNRQYYHNTYLDSFEPIYYDGMFELTKPIIKFNEVIYSNFQILQIEKYLKLLNNNNIRNNLKYRFNSRIIGNRDDFFSKSLIQITKNLNYAKKIISETSPVDKKIKNNKDRSYYFQNHKKNEFNQLVMEDIKMKQNEYLVELVSVLDNKRFSKNISSNDLAKVLSDNRLEKQRTIFLPQNRIFDDMDLNLKKIHLNGGKVFYSKNINLNVRENEKTIEVTQSFSNDWILFSNNIFDGWKILFNGISFYGKKNDIPNINQHGMNGCMNFHNVFFNNTTLELQNGKCEDTINIVKSTGSIKLIKVKSAFSDALDIDFSKIEIDQGVIENAGNDCADFSGGKYKINYFELSNCGDKAISVGEKSIFNLMKANIKDSNIGIASKDSSISKIDSVNLKNVEMCLTAYNKKQEFHGGYMELNNILCKNFSKKINQDNQSNVVVNYWN